MLMNHDWMEPDKIKTPNGTMVDGECEEATGTVIHHIDSGEVDWERQSELDPTN